MIIETLVSAAVVGLFVTAAPEQFSEVMDTAEKLYEAEWNLLKTTAIKIKDVMVKTQL